MNRVLRFPSQDALRQYKRRKNRKGGKKLKKADMVEAVAEPDEVHVGRRHQHRRLSSSARLPRRERHPQLLVPPHGPRAHPGRRRAEEGQQLARGGREVHGEGRGRTLLPAEARGGGHGRGGGGLRRLHRLEKAHAFLAALVSGVGFLVAS